MYGHISPKWFKHEVYTCPSCNTKYKRMEFDTAQAACPRCLNKEWLEPESNTNEQNINI